MEYTPIKPDEYFIIQIPTPSPPEWRRQRASFMFPPFSLLFFHTCIYVFLFFVVVLFRLFFCMHRQERSTLKSLVQVPLRASVTGLFRLLLLRCFLFCQNASLQVNSDLKTSSPWGRLQHSLLSSFKHNLFHSLLSGPIPPPPPPTLLFPAPPPAPSSVWFCSLPARLLLLPEPSSLRETLVHGPPHLPSALPFN